MCILPTCTARPALPYMWCMVHGTAPQCYPTSPLQTQHGRTSQDQRIPAWALLSARQDEHRMASVMGSGKTGDIIMTIYPGHANHASSSLEALRLGQHRSDVVNRMGGEQPRNASPARAARGWHSCEGAVLAAWGSPAAGCAAWAAAQALCMLPAHRTGSATPSEGHTVPDPGCLQPTGHAIIRVGRFCRPQRLSNMHAHTYTLMRRATRIVWSCYPGCQGCSSRKQVASVVGNSA